VPAGYTLQWEEDFNYSGAPDPDIWTYDYFSGGNGEDVTYTNSPDNARVEGGKLVIEVHQILDSRAPRYTSARLITRDKAFWKYGRIEVRAKLPSETGTWPAIWMLSNNPVYGNGEWPDTGEIDIMEHVGYEEDPLFKQVVGNPTLPNIHGTIHTSKFNGLENAGIGSRTFIETASTEFHTYAINWYEDRIEWEVDGVNYFTQELEPLLPVRNPPEDPWEWWPFDQPFYLILNVAVGGNWGGHFNSTFYPGVSPYGTNGIDDDGVWPQRMEVDYVKAYAPGEDAEWKGLPIDEFGNADTNSWLGWINVNNDPWLYSYTLQKYILMTAATEEIFHTDSQWVYIPNH
jgi:beta-glucanase (GH16 family)